MDKSQINPQNQLNLNDGLSVNTSSVDTPSNTNNNNNNDNNNNENIEEVEETVTTQTTPVDNYQTEIPKINYERRNRIYEEHFDRLKDQRRKSYRGLFPQTKTQTQTKKHIIKQKKKYLRKKEDQRKLDYRLKQLESKLKKEKEK